MSMLMRLIPMPDVKGSLNEDACRKAYTAFRNTMDGLKKDYKIGEPKKIGESKGYYNFLKKEVKKDPVPAQKETFAERLKATFDVCKIFENLLDNGNAAISTAPTTAIKGVLYPDKKIPLIKNENESEIEIGNNLKLAQAFLNFLEQAFPGEIPDNLNTGLYVTQGIDLKDIKKQLKKQTEAYLDKQKENKAAPVVAVEQKTEISSTTHAEKQLTDTSLDNLEKESKAAPVIAVEQKAVSEDKTSLTSSASIKRILAEEELAELKQDLINDREKLIELQNNLIYSLEVLNGLSEEVSTLKEQSPKAELNLEVEKILKNKTIQIEEVRMAIDAKLEKQQELLKAHREKLQEEVKKTQDKLRNVRKFNVEITLKFRDGLNPKEAIRSCEEKRKTQLEIDLKLEQKTKDQWGEAISRNKSRAAAFKSIPGNLLHMVWHQEFPLTTLHNEIKNITSTRMKELENDEKQQKIAIKEAEETLTMITEERMTLRNNQIDFYNSNKKTGAFLVENDEKQQKTVIKEAEEKMALKNSQIDSHNSNKKTGAFLVKIKKKTKIFLTVLEQALQRASAVLKNIHRFKGISRKQKEETDHMSVSALAASSLAEALNSPGSEAQAIAANMSLTAEPPTFASPSV